MVLDCPGMSAFDKAQTEFRSGWQNYSTQALKGKFCWPSRILQWHHSSCTPMPKENKNTVNVRISDLTQPIDETTK